MISIKFLTNVTGTDKGAPVLNAGSGNFGVPLLNGWDKHRG